MLFGALFSALILLRTGAEYWPHGAEKLNVPLATVNTFVLIASSVTVVMAWASLRLKDFAKFKLYMWLTFACGLGFMVIKAIEYSSKFSHHIYPSTDNFYATYFLLTGLARSARHRRHGGVRLLPGAGRQDVADRARALHQPDRGRRSLLALRRPGLDLPLPDPLSTVRRDMGGHTVEEIKQETRVYRNVFLALAAFTAITVAISYLDVSFGVALALALLVATVKGSLVACYFMHLLSERKLIYTVLWITVDLLPRADDPAPRHHPGIGGGLTMSLRIFHVLFVALSIALSAMVAGWGIQQYLTLGDRGGLWLAAFFFVVGLALVLYGAQYFKKLKELS